MPSPGGEVATRAVREQIQAWIDSPSFRDLLVLYGQDPDVLLRGSLNHVLEQLETFSDRWDFRRMARERGAASDDKLPGGIGAARWLSADAELPADWNARILADVEKLGLIRAEDPKELEYDQILVLGGARLSCKLRAIRAVEILGQGTRAGVIGLLGAARPVGEGERDATDSYAPRALDEFDLAIAGAQHAFGFNVERFTERRHDDPANKNREWRIRRFEAATGNQQLPIVAVSAPSSDPDRRRANSADTIMFFLDHEPATHTKRILLITSQIYVPYVQLEAIRTVAFPRGVTVETIGFPGDRMPELQGMSNPHHYLQEVRSAIQAARRLCHVFPT